MSRFIPSNFFCFVVLFFLLNVILDSMLAEHKKTYVCLILSMCVNSTAQRSLPVHWPDEPKCSQATLLHGIDYTVYIFLLFYSVLKGSTRTKIKFSKKCIGLCFPLCFVTKMFFVGLQSYKLDIQDAIIEIKHWL